MSVSTQYISQAINALHHNGIIIYPTETAYSIADVRASFGDDMQKIDAIVDDGVLPYTPPSTLVKVENENIEILREGPISEGKIRKIR